MSSPRHFNFLIFMNDPKFTEKLKKWFDCEHTDANIREGALLLLQMNNNRHLYQLINFDPQGKLELLKYELQKHLNYRIEGMTIDDVRNYDKAVTPVLQTAVDKTSEADKIAEQLAPHLPVVESENIDSIVPSAIVAKGKRADHDQLPENIQAIWDNNCALWKKSRNTLRLARLTTCHVTDTRACMLLTKTSNVCSLHSRRSTMHTSRPWMSMTTPSLVMPRRSKRRSSQ